MIIDRDGIMLALRERDLVYFSSNAQKALSQIVIYWFVIVFPTRPGNSVWRNNRSLVASIHLLFFKERKLTNMDVSEVMTRKVITISEDQSREQAARLLSQYRISGLPVLNADGLLVGVVTEYDVIAKNGRTVSDIMTRSIISVTPDTDVDAASHILVNERIKRLPVIDRGKLVGIVSRADVVRMVAMRWICPVCGEVAYGERPPELCPRCGAAEISAAYEAEPPGS